MVGNIGNHSVMNLILRPLNDVNDPVWSVILSIMLLLCMVVWVIYYILRIDKNEYGCYDSPEQEELLQLQSGRDQQSP